VVARRCGCSHCDLGRGRAAVAVPVRQILPMTTNQGDSTMAQPVKGVSNPPQSESQAEQPTSNARKQTQKPATPPPLNDTVKISSAGRAASAGNVAIKPQKP
jgi:hypothetical protein